MMGGSWWTGLTECGPLEKGMANHFILSGDQWRNNSRKNEGMEPKQKQYPAVDVTGDKSKVR